MLTIIRFRKPLFCNQLYISNEPYFIAKSRALGEKDLTDLVDTGKSEGCWLFDVERSNWYNLKTEDKKDHGIMAITPDLSRFGELSHYHTHPKHFEEEDRKKFLEDFPEPNQFPNEFLHIVRNILAMYMVIPSEGDIKTYSQIIQVAPKHTVDFRIVSPYGITRLEFDRPADIHEVNERYREINSNHKKLNEIAESVTNPKQAISQAVHLINQHLQGVFTLSMEYRLGDIR